MFNSDSPLRQKLVITFFHFFCLVGGVVEYEHKRRKERKMWMRRKMARVKETCIFLPMMFDHTSYTIT